MVKLVFVLLGSFWLSCGNIPKTAENKTITSEEKTESIQKVSTDIALSNTLEKETVPTADELKRDVEKTPKDIEISDQKPSKHVAIVKQKSEAKENVNALPNHVQWSALLSKYVNDKGDVNYKGFQNDVSILDDYLNHLAENSPEKDWSKNEKLAYYINLYNAATVKLILDNYPTISIKEIKKPWGKKWIKTGDGVLSLGNIEHKILRKMDEPRIHFAINCASFSCPKLLNKAFTADQMEAQLHMATLDFINDRTQNSISKEKMQLSNIFKWYKKDFTDNGTLAEYIKPYTDVEIDTDTDIDYLKYDWNLNEAK